MIMYDSVGSINSCVFFRLYCAQVDAPERRACQLVMNHILETVTRAVAPVLPHLAEEVFLYHPCKEG